MSDKGRLHRGKAGAGALPPPEDGEGLGFSDIFPELPAEAGYSGEPPIPEAAAIRREREAARELRQSAWWKEQLARGVCHYCGGHFPPERLTMDHLVPVSRGGRSVRANVVPCCKECNNRKKYLLPTEMAQPVAKSPAALEDSIYRLVADAATILPEDVAEAIAAAQSREEPGAPASQTLQTICQNAQLAQSRRLPLCQDTGLINFFITAPDGTPQRPIEEAARRAVVRATADGLLRQNCVEVPSGRNTGNNLGYVNPAFHWETAATPSAPLRISVLLKGGGSENVGIQYSLPDAALGAGRDLEGVRRCVLDAALQAQGRGCAPGIFGVAIGGDRCGGWEEAKRQLLRPIGQRHPEADLAALETRLLSEINSLGIGPMGLGGRTTALEVFLGTRARHPASYFVTVCYNCWCCRRRSIVLE